MAKKSSSSRHKPTTARAKSPAQKQQTPERASTATLVRPGGATGPSASNVVVAPPEEASAPQPSAQPKPKPAARKPTTAAKAPVAEKSVAPASSPATAQPATAAKPAPSKPNAPRPAASTAREQNAQLARVRATQRARTAHTISAENYAYVLSDLKLVVGLAVTAFVVLIALTFVLPH